MYAGLAEGNASTNTAHNMYYRSDLSPNGQKRIFDQSGSQFVLSQHSGNVNIDDSEVPAKFKQNSPSHIPPGVTQEGG